jgi:hypothetical protein
MKTFLKFSVVLVLLGIIMAVFTLTQSVKKTGEIPTTPPTTQQENNLHLQQHPNEK